MKPNDPSPLFNQYAESYDETLEKSLRVTGESAEYYLKRRIQQMVKRLTEWNIEIRSFLDFGCGIGNATPVLQKYLPGVRLVGVDLSTDCIAVAQRRFTNDDIELLSLQNYTPSGKFDAAYCNGVFHHVLPADRQEVIEIVYRSLKPGGIFVLCDNNPWNPGTRYITRKTEFDKDAVLMSAWEARKRLRRQHFEVLKTDHQFIFPRFLHCLVPIERYFVSFPIGGKYIIFAQKQKT